MYFVDEEEEEVQSSYDWVQRCSRQNRPHGIQSFQYALVNIILQVARGADPTLPSTS